MKHSAWLERGVSVKLRTNVASTSVENWSCTHGGGWSKAVVNCLRCFNWRVRKFGIRLVRTTALFTYVEFECMVVSAWKVRNWDVPVKIYRHRRGSSSGPVVTHDTLVGAIRSLWYLHTLSTRLIGSKHSRYISGCHLCKAKAIIRTSLPGTH